MIHQRLVTEHGFCGSYQRTKLYVGEARERLWPICSPGWALKEGRVELGHSAAVGDPGDFGAARRWLERLGIDPRPGTPLTRPA